MDIPETIRAAARRWVVQQDRGLSDAEKAALQRWLERDPRHGRALQQAAGAWSLLDRLPRAALAPVARPARGRWWLAAGLGAAAALGLIVAWHRPVRPVAAEPAELAAALPASSRVLHLPDGSTVLLNLGGAAEEHFTPGERDVVLVRGEAQFDVAKNPARPFIVRAGPVRIRAVGTAFDVNSNAGGVEVIVSEGRVTVAAPAAGTPLVRAGQRAVVSFPGRAPRPAIAVSAISSADMARALAWQQPLLNLGGSTLAEIAAAFREQTGRRIILADPGLAALRIGGRFRRDDLEGFVQVLEANYGLRSEPTADGSIILRPAR